MNCFPLISAIVIMLVSSRFAAEASSQQPRILMTGWLDRKLRFRRAFFARQKMRRYRVCGECGNLISDELTAVISGSVMTVLSS